MATETPSGEPVERLSGRFSHVQMDVKDHGLRYRVVNMTPPLAEQLLEKSHPRQRPAKPRKIAVFASDMAAGRWMLNGEPIIVDEDGYTCNGRNRLLAVLKSQATVRMVICYGAPRASVVTMDTGTSRNVNDAAHFLGRALPGQAYAGVARQMSVARASTSPSCISAVRRVPPAC